MRMLNKKEFVSIFKKVPRVTVDVVIRDREGILLIKREITPEMGKWHLPGGTIHYKENILHAVKRKTHEETGLKIRIKKFLGVIEFMRWKEPGYTHVIDLVFLANPISGKLKGNKEKCGECLKFFKKLPKNMIPEQKRIIQDKLSK